MKNFVQLLLVFIVFLALSPQSVSAGEPPKPEQGHASGSIMLKCQPSYTTEMVSENVAVTADFWNVGKLWTGQDYSGMSFKMISTADPKRMCIVGGNLTFSFAGGPNGKIETGGPEFPIHLRMVNGSYIEFTYDQNFEYSVPTGVGSFNKSARYSNTVVVNLPIQNPEIFTRYDWGENAAKSRLEDSMAAFSDLSGQVEVNIPNEDGTYNEEKWDFAKLDGRTFPVGTHIKTSDRSTAVISFGDMTTFTMKPETEIILSSPAAQDSQIKLLAGNLWINVKKMFKDGSMEIEMSQAVAGIKGTVLVLEETGEKSTLKVIEGSVSYRSKINGQTEAVAAGETVTANKDGLGQKTAFDAAAENESWNNLADSFSKTSATPKNYPYYIGISALLAAVVIGIVLAVRKKRRN